MSLKLRGYFVGFYGKRGFAKVQYAKKAIVYFNGKKVREIEFPKTKRKVADREKYVTNIVKKLDRERRRERGELPPRPVRIPKVKPKGLVIPEKRLPEASLKPSFAEFYTHHYQSESEITRGYSGSVLKTNRLEKTWAEMKEGQKVPKWRKDQPIEITRENKGEMFDLLKREFKDLALKLSESEVPGNGDYLLRIKTLEKSIRGVWVKQGFTATPGRFHADNLTDLMEQIDILFEAFSSSFDQYVKRTLSKSIFIRSLWIEEVVDG